MNGIFALIFVAIGLLVYLLPTVIAHRRQHRKAVGLFWLNFFLGWTLVGWVAALVWAVSGDSFAGMLRCPACRELVREDATVCRHCQAALTKPRGRAQVL